MTQLVQIILYAAVLVIGLTVNFAWDLTVRRRKARELAGERREARPRALPPALDDAEQARRLPDEGLRRFVVLTRASFVQLDELINQFDLLLLRARDRAKFGLVTIHSEIPRASAKLLLERWLDGWVDVDDEARERLRAVALGPETVVGVLERERGRMLWEYRRDSAPVLYETITDLDRAVIHMQGIVAHLERGVEDPYR